MSVIRTRRTIDNAGADAVMAAAARHAEENGYRVVIAVVDPSGELIGMRRTKGAQVASSRVAVDKARTAAIFIRPSREIEQQVTDGRLGALALRGAAALTGGIPLNLDGEVVGAVGTSGETPDEDESCSIAGAAADFSTAEKSAAAPAIEQDSSSSGVSPLVPTAPTTSPSRLSGIPPVRAAAPRSARAPRRPSVTCCSISRLGRMKIAAVRALSTATRELATCAPSVRRIPISSPEGSTTAITTR